MSRPRLERLKENRAKLLSRKKELKGLIDSGKATQENIDELKEVKEKITGLNKAIKKYNERAKSAKQGEKGKEYRSSNKVTAEKRTYNQNVSDKGEKKDNTSSKQTTKNENSKSESTEKPEEQSNSKPKAESAEKPEEKSNSKPKAEGEKEPGAQSSSKSKAESAEKPEEKSNSKPKAESTKKTEDKSNSKTKSTKKTEAQSSSKPKGKNAKEDEKQFDSETVEKIIRKSEETLKKSDEVLNEIARASEEIDEAWEKPVDGKDGKNNSEIEKKSEPKAKEQATQTQEEKDIRKQEQNSDSKNELDKFKKRLAILEQDQKMDRSSAGSISRSRQIEELKEQIRKMDIETPVNSNNTQNSSVEKTRSDDEIMAEFEKIKDELDAELGSPIINDEKREELYRKFVEVKSELLKKQKGTQSKETQSNLPPKQRTRSDIENDLAALGDHFLEDEEKYKKYLDLLLELENLEKQEKDNDSLTKKGQTSTETSPKDSNEGQSNDNPQKGNELVKKGFWSKLWNKLINFGKRIKNKFSRKSKTEESKKDEVKNITTESADNLNIGEEKSHVEDKEFKQIDENVSLTAQEIMQDVVNEHTSKAPEFTIEKDITVTGADPKELKEMEAVIERMDENIKSGNVQPEKTRSKGTERERD